MGVQEGREYRREGAGREVGVGVGVQEGGVGGGGKGKGGVGVQEGRWEVGYLTSMSLQLRRSPSMDQWLAGSSISSEVTRLCCWAPPPPNLLLVNSSSSIIS